MLEFRKRPKGVKLLVSALAIVALACGGGESVQASNETEQETVDTADVPVGNDPPKGTVLDSNGYLIPVGETLDTSPEESRCPTAEQMKESGGVGSVEYVACKFLLHSELGDFPKKFNYVQALELELATRGAERTVWRHGEGKIGDDEAIGILNELAVTCESITGLIGGCHAVLRTWGFWKDQPEKWTREQ